MNSKLFGNTGHGYQRPAPVPKTDTRNEAGGVAYKMDEWSALCQLGMTGFFQNQVYITGEQQLANLVTLAAKFPPAKVLQLACVSRQRGYLKDMAPALMLSVQKRDQATTHRAFPHIVDADKPLKACLSMCLSGHFGMKDVGYALKKDFERAIRSWSPEKLVALAIGNVAPTIRDIFRLVHPKPQTLTERATWGYLLNNNQDRWGQGAGYEHLPPVLQALVKYDRAESEDQQLSLVPELSRIRWERLASNAKGLKVIKALVRYMKPQALRMNLKSISKKGAFINDPQMIDLVISKLTDAQAIANSRQFAYQYLTAYENCGPDVPVEVKAALHKAADIATGNVPVMPGPVAVIVDVSGSMRGNPVTGFRDNHQTPTHSIDVAALMGTSLWRKTPGSVLIPVDTRVHKHNLNPSDSLLTITKNLAAFGGGGTSLSLAVNHLNVVLRQTPFAGIVLLSDNESWCDPRANRGTPLAQEFRQFQINQQRIGVYPNPKMICVDLTPNTTTQVKDSEDICNLGGYTDAVFEMIEMFMIGDLNRFTDYVECFEF